MLYGSWRPVQARDPEWGLGRIRGEELALSGMLGARRGPGRPAHCGVRVSLPGEPAEPLWQFWGQTGLFRNQATLGPLYFPDFVQELQNERLDLDPVELGLDRQPVLEMAVWNDRVGMRLLQRTV